jgi:hypothetical protein
MASTAEQAGGDEPSPPGSRIEEDPFGPPVVLTEEQLRQGDFNKRVWRLMDGYEPSYSAGAAKLEWQLAPGGEDDPYGGPFYETAAEAQEAAEWHRQACEAAQEALGIAEDAEHSARADLEHLRAELERTRPWQRRHRQALRDQIADAASEVFELGLDVSRFDSQDEYCQRKHLDATWIADVLRRHEHARRAGEEAVARALGWRPGSAATNRRAVFQAGTDIVVAQTGSERVLPSEVRTGPALTVQVRRGGGLPLSDREHGRKNEPERPPQVPVREGPAPRM